MRWRWLFVLVLIGGAVVFPPGGIEHAPAQSSPNGAQILTSTGTPGTFTAAFKIGRCYYTNPGGTWQAEIELPAPTVSPRQGVSNQRITWEPRLYQGLSGLPAHQLLRAEPAQSSQATGGSVNFAAAELSGFPQGPAYIAGGVISWLSNDVVIGTIAFIFTQHDTFVGASNRVGQNLKHCTQFAPAEITLSTQRTTVNVTVQLAGRYFPISAPVNITWNGKTIGQAMSDANGTVSTSIKVPAAPLGDYRLALDAGTLWKPSSVLTVVPRIKVIPDIAARGDTVKISLRGFARKEVVRIRWNRNGTWVEIGRITTSSTGSGELWIPVPAWAADGVNPVRGDGPGARAQTNAFTVDGGPVVSLASEEPTPEPGTPEPIVDPLPATPAPAETPSPIDGETPEGSGTPGGATTSVTPESDAPATPAP